MTSRVCRTIRSSVPCKTSPRGGAMLSPLDQQQEHRLRPVECQQEDSLAKKRPPRPPRPCPPPAFGRSREYSCDHQFRCGCRRPCRNLFEGDELSFTQELT